MPQCIIIHSPARIWITLVLTCFLVGILERDRLQATLVDVFDEQGYLEHYTKITGQIPHSLVLDEFSRWQSLVVQTFHSTVVMGKIVPNQAKSMSLPQSMALATPQTTSAVTDIVTTERRPSKKVSFSGTHPDSPWLHLVQQFFDPDLDLGMQGKNRQKTLGALMFKAPYFNNKSIFDTASFVSKLSQENVHFFKPEFLTKPAFLPHLQKIQPGMDPRERDCPTRVLLVGDSLMMEGFGPVLLRTLRHRQDFEVRREAKYSTGLCRPDYFNWEMRMAELVQEFNPDLVIICLGANDAQDIIDEQKKRHIAGTLSWAGEYFKRALTLADLAQTGGAKLIWVGLPIMGKEPHATRVKMLSQEQLAATLVAPETRIYVDTYAVLADEQGQYTSLLPDANGIPVRMRHKDKVHVNEAGGKVLVQSVLPFVDLFFPSQTLSLTEQVHPRPQVVQSP